ncbi:unnamed protein product [Effrenium voratum]|uniref:Uncharacterized protein n=1 Tax=Effrenium voratum TaxID=2562239 RepID=A0AA36JJ49_9DINO|nr:unnamed protein product [Effrenium voratum]
MGEQDAFEPDWAAITVDCLTRKLRATVRVEAFGEAKPRFAEQRVQLEPSGDLLPLIPRTRAALYEDGDVVDAEERALVAHWLQQKLQPQFDFPVEVTAESASHHGKVLPRFAGCECSPGKNWQRFYSTFHIDHKQNCATMEEGVQVNVWLNLSERPISDFHLGFLEQRGAMLAGKDLPHLTQEDLQEVAVRYQALLGKDEALIFQSTGAMSVAHGSFRFQNEQKLTHEPRYSLEFRLLLRRVS